MTQRVRAIGLLSGGLDSTLAAKIMLELGVDVKAVNFSTGFCLTDHHRMMQRPTDRAFYNESLRAARDLDIEIEIIDISREYTNVLFNPKHGYGSGMNPCLDCRGFMLAKAKSIMEAEGASFVFTGEVLGQRPMSQYRHALKVVERESQLEGLVLRPLSAQLLEPTIPELEGWVDRDRLLDISGRSRKKQIALAVQYGVTDYPQPAGGCCCLPDQNYARKLRDLIQHRGTENLTTEDFVLLKIGRHFRLSEHCKVIIGRDEKENEFLNRFKPGRIRLEPTSHVGPVALVEGAPSQEQMQTIAGITARYSDGVDAPVVILTCSQEERTWEMSVTPLPAEAYEEYRV